MTIYRDVCLVGQERTPPDPCELYFEIHGKGAEKILFIMGLNRSAESWELQVDFFRRFPDFQVCVFDNRGVGRSGVTEDVYTTQQMALDTRDLLTYIGWTESVNVVACDFGAMIALELSAEVPANFIKSMCLVSAQAGRLFPSMGSLMGLAKVMLTDSTMSRFEVAVDNLYPVKWLVAPAPPGSGFENNRAYVLDLMRRQAGRVPEQEAEGSRGQMLASARHGTTPAQLAAIKRKFIACLVLAGELDTICDPSSGKSLGKELAAKVRIFQGCGHVPYVQEKDKFNEVLLEFLGGLMPEDGELPEFEAIEMGPFAIAAAAEIDDDEIIIDDIAVFESRRRQSAVVEDEFGAPEAFDARAELMPGRKASTTRPWEDPIAPHTNGAGRSDSGIGGLSSSLHPLSRTPSISGMNGNHSGPTSAGTASTMTVDRDGAISPGRLLASLSSPPSMAHSNPSASFFDAPGSDETVTDDFDIDFSAPHVFSSKSTGKGSSDLSRGFDKKSRRMSRLEVELYHDAEVEEILI